MVEWKECECLGLRVKKRKNSENHDRNAEYDARFVFNSQNIFVDVSAQNYTPHEEAIQHYGERKFVPKCAVELNV